MLDDRGRVIASDAAAEQVLLQSRHVMRVSKVFIGDSFKFRQPSANEVSARILLGGLAGWGVDADGVNPGDSGLHLALAVVDAGFVIEEQSGEVQGGLSPVQPQVVGGERHQHGPHSKINPCSCLQRPHAGVDHGIPCDALLPYFEQILAEVIFAEPVEGRIDVAEFNGRFIFEFLDEVAVPCQPRFETGKRLEPGGIDVCLVLFIAQLQDSSAPGVYGFADGEAAEGQEGADATAGFGGGEGAGHFAAVVESAGVQEGVQAVFSGLSSAGLRRADAWCCETSLLPCEGRDGRDLQVGWQRRNCGRFGNRGLPHSLFPDGGPVIAAGQSPHDSVAGKLVARNIVGSRPRTDSTIPLVTDPVAGFFVSING